ncbi:hypothetical protein JCM6882_007878 [Rhodosporidiobolus microsporus]
MSAKSSYAVQQLISKLKNPDADLRFMALQDLLSESRQPGFGIDEATEYQLVDQVLGLVNDANGEVKSQAVKTLATLVPLLSPSRHAVLIDRLVQFTSSADEGVRDIASLGLKMVVAEVTPASQLAGTVCSKLAPEVVKQLNDSSSSAELVLDSLDLLSDILTRFSSTLAPNTALQSSILKACTPLLSAPRAAVRKRAVSTLAVLISSTSAPSSTSSSSASASAASSALLTSLLDSTLLPSLRAPSASGSLSANESLRTSISLASALARAAPAQLGPRVGEVVPLVLEGSKREDDEGKEGVLQCLESLTLKLPAETGAYLNAVVDKATELLRYDPNFGGGEDEDEEMEEAEEGGDEDEFDDEFEDEYDDEDDTSWKVRRSATKLLTSIVSTRPDLLSSFYKTVSPALIARFGDREETVRVEVWATYTALLRQTRALVRPSSVTGVGAGGVGGAMTPPGGASPRGNGSLKRKRSDDRMDTEEGPLSQLNAQTPQIVKSIVKQLGAAKALPTRQAAFVLLHELIAVLDGGLETQIPALVARVEASMKTADSGLSGAATALKIEVLAFLARFFRTHHVKTFADELPRLTPLVCAAIADRFNKIAAEAFVTAAELVKVLRPVPSRSSSNTTAAAPVPAAYTPHLAALYQSTMDKLAGSDADEDVKGKGILTLGTLLFHAGDSLPADGALEAALTFLRDRLKNEVQRVVAVRTVGVVAASPVLGKGNPTVDAWAAACLPDVSALLRKVHRPLKVAAFDALDALLERAGPGAVDAAAAQAILADLTPLLGSSSGGGASSSEGADVNLLPHALTTLATLLTVSPSASSALSTGGGGGAQGPLARILTDLVPSPLIQGPSLDALLKFFAAAVRAGVDPKGLIQQLGQAGDVGATKGGAGVEGEEEAVHAAATAGRCVGVVVREAPQEADGVVKDAEKVIKSSKSSPSQLLLALLTLGEVGRVIDFAAHKATFAKVVDHFAASSEDVRRAAAFAAGNIAVGNTSVFLPAILELIEGDDKKRYLALQALKEVIIHSSPDALASISDTLWTPLFDNCEAQEEGTRNVAADCLGQLTVLNPAKYLPQLQARLGADSRHTRATVIAALRFTFTNDSSTYDELLAPLIGEFFKLMQDSDLGVRRLALSSLNSAAHNKPHLVRPHLDTLLPELYAQTEVDESLIRIVEMGPFKHKVDDGLDVRKAAYECMHTLVDACREQIDLAAYLARVIEGLKDEEEVKKLCYVMLVKLAQVAPTAVQQRLDDTVPPFTEVFGIVLKDTATKQEAERTLELQRSAIRCIAVLNRLASTASTPKFATFISSQIANGKMASEFKESTRQSQAVAMDLD